MDVFALPYWAVMTMLTGASVALACALHILVRRMVPYTTLVEHNDVAGFMIAVVGVLYAVLMAFVVVVVWQQYNDSDSNYGREVSTVADIVAYARSLPAHSMRAVDGLVDHYVIEMIDDEWPAMRRGASSAAATATLAALSRTIAAVLPHEAVVLDARNRLQGSAQQLFDLRNHRLSDNVETLPPVLWAALVVGAAITVGFGFLFGVGNFRVQLIMTGAVAALIAIMFTLLVELDFPFRRDSAISAARWTELQRFLSLARLPGPPAPFAPKSLLP